MMPELRCFSNNLDKTRALVSLAIGFPELWCPLPDSNRHSVRKRILSPQRLPIPPRGRAATLYKLLGNVKLSNKFSG